jgi:hypothetical protein
MLKESLIGKFLPCKLIGVVNNKNLKKFRKIGIVHHVSCPLAHQQKWLR